MGECGVKVGVGDFLDAKHIEHPVVGLRLHALKLVNRDLAVVDRNEVEQLTILVNVNVQLLDRRCVGVNIFLDR